MNRQRHRAKTMAPTVEIMEVTAGESLIAGSICRCAWQNCLLQFKGDLPEGWTWMITYLAKEPVLLVGDMEEWRSCCLCPEHWHTMESQLEGGIAPELLGPPAGRT